MTTKQKNFYSGDAQQQYDDGFIYWINYQNPMN